MKDNALTVLRSSHSEKWQQILADLITDPKELLEILRLDPLSRPASIAAMGQFPLKAPRPFVSRMRPGDWEDPLLRQVWPDQRETEDSPELVADPLQENQYIRAPGLIQKYQGRVLLSAAPHCAIHCRYCFRRHFDYAANSPDRRQWHESLRLLREDSSIGEVILSGGDPLANSDAQLDWLIGELESVDHVHSLRIHSRLPVVIPQRLTAGLLDRLTGSRFRVVLVIHCNHARELDDQVSERLEIWARSGITLLNQSVLLAGVNDRVETLKQLSDALFAAHVLPYYLHLPDKVAGTNHFQVEAVRARRLLQELSAQSPGYLVPRLVQEVPGAAAKTALL